MKKSGVNPLISNSGEKISTSQTKNIAITRVKRLKVTILKGKVIFLRKGLTAKFKIPKRIPAKVKVVRKRLISAVLVGKTNKGPVKWTLGTNLWLNHSPRIAEIIWMSKFHTASILSENSIIVNAAHSLLKFLS